MKKSHFLVLFGVVSAMVVSAQDHPQSRVEQYIESLKIVDGGDRKSVV